MISAVCHEHREMAGALPSALPIIRIGQARAYSSSRVGVALTLAAEQLCLLRYGDVGNRLRDVRVLVLEGRKVRRRELVERAAAVVTHGGQRAGNSHVLRGLYEGRAGDGWRLDGPEDRRRWTSSHRGLCVVPYSRTWLGATGNGG